MEEEEIEESRIITESNRQETLSNSWHLVTDNEKEKEKENSSGASNTVRTTSHANPWPRGMLFDSVSGKDPLIGGLRDLRNAENFQTKSSSVKRPEGGRGPKEPVFSWFNSGCEDELVRELER